MPKSKEAKKAAVKKAAAPAPKAAAPATKEAAPATKAAAPETKAAAPAKKVAAKKRRELQTAQDPPSNLNRYSDPKSNQFRSQPAEGQETPFKEGSNLMTASTVLLSALIMIVY